MSASALVEQRQNTSAALKGRPQVKESSAGNRKFSWWALWWPKPEALAGGTRIRSIMHKETVGGQHLKTMLAKSRRRKKKKNQLEHDNYGP